MPAPSLHQLAKRGCVKNIKSIVDIGDAPYPIVRDVLVKIRDPEQLRQIEINSPQIWGEDGEIWQNLIKCNLPQKESNSHTPKDPRNWYKVYRVCLPGLHISSGALTNLYQKLHKEHQAAILKDAEVLKAAMDGIKTERASHTSKLVDMKSLPQNLRKHTAVGSRDRSTGNSRGGSSILTFGSGTRTKNMTGRQVVDKARRDAREQGIFSGRRCALNTPTHQLSSKASAVKSVPKGLPDADRAMPPTMFAPKRKIPASKATPPSDRSTATPNGLSIEERERRLKAFTSSSPSTKHAPAATKRDSSGNPTSTATVAASSPPSPSCDIDSLFSEAPRTYHKVPRLKPVSPYRSPPSGSPEPNGGSKGLASSSPTPPRKAKPAVDPFMRNVKRRKITS
ncbi:MAG: hypothetical protein M1837_006095 [Sclerophora amabilis]|nr:MAG: hypothetical protein M1837_006095 [Sclerophora amabilis]